nr:MAG TPA: hypothetical protein [Bacteriophage sp.]
MISWYTPCIDVFLAQALTCAFLVLQSAPIAHRVMFQCFIRLMNGKKSNLVKIFLGKNYEYKLHSTVSRGYGLKMVMLFL